MDKPITSEKSLEKLMAAIASLGEQLRNSDPVEDQKRVDEYEREAVSRRRFTPAHILPSPVVRKAAEPPLKEPQSTNMPLPVVACDPIGRTIALWNELKGARPPKHSSLIGRNVLYVLHHFFKGDMRKYEEYIRAMSLHPHRLSLEDVLQDEWVQKVVRD